MNNENLNRLKKYLFLISIFFVILTGSHIIYTYLYDNAIETPMEGGSVSEGIVGDFPNLNPLLNNTDYNKNINYLLYRGLLKYDIKKDEIIGDLANCNLKNLSNIECYLKDNIFWSNGDKITIDDVIATFNILKNSDINPTLLALIKDTSIENQNGAIVFKNKIKDIAFLQVLFQGILPKKILDNIGNTEMYGKFNPLNGIYSGPYKVDTVSYDDSLGIQKLILIKNEYYKEKNILISKYIYKIFKDQTQLLKHKDLVNIFFDKNKILADSMPRLEKYSYYLNQYNILFLNEEKLNNLDLRNFILSKIDIKNILNILGKGYIEDDDIFLNKELVQNFSLKNSNIESILKESGYYKKDFLVNYLLDKEKQKEEKIENSNLIYIKSPVNKKYSFLSKDDLLIEGDIGSKKPDEIYINDYKLSSYKPGDKKFYYRLKTEFKNYAIGDNGYKVYFVSNKEKKLVETFYITYNTDEKKLDESKKVLEEKIKKSNNESKIEIDKKIQDKILSLPDNNYYNKDLNKFLLRLLYIENKDDILKTANIIKTSLETFGIGVDLVPTSITDLNKKIISGEKNYDILILGLDLGYFPQNIYPYFHSSQAKNGYNFSGVKNLDLDIYLEELKQGVLSSEKVLDLEKKSIEIFALKQIFKPLYLKESIVLIDNNIKNFILPQNTPSDLLINEALLDSYVVSDRKIDFSKKSIKGFYDFVKKAFN
ncbi:hypothetical protein H3C61_02930 [Candidatus Gracilibacteria bacterium]|nr:hypothetical protein [Candidatus Gracilibacteria bacterium]